MRPPLATHRSCIRSAPRMHSPCTNLPQSVFTLNDARQVDTRAMHRVQSGLQLILRSLAPGLVRDSAGVATPREPPKLRVFVRHATSVRTHPGAIRPHGLTNAWWASCPSPKGGSRKLYEAT